MNLRIEKLSEANFKDYEKLTACQSEGGCYCSFWHQKWTSMEDWESCKKKTPDLNRQVVFEKMRSGFHVGVLVYDGTELLAWVSVGPLIDFYWTWKRVVHIGEPAKSVAGILCFTIADEYKGQGLQAKILNALKDYGRTQKWTSIEGYPFDESALEIQKDKVLWPGLTKGFVEAGFIHEGKHWLSGKDWERSIYKVEL